MPFENFEPRKSASKIAHNFFENREPHTMSSTLFWQPVLPADKTLSSGLKLLLRDVYGFPVDRNFTPHQIGELTALKAGRHAEVQKEIDELIQAIERHDIIHVFESNW